MNTIRTLIGNLFPPLGLGLLIGWMNPWAIPVGIGLFAFGLKYGHPNC